MLEKIFLTNFLIALVLIFEISKYFKKNQLIKTQFIGILLSLISINLYHGPLNSYSLSFLLDILGTFGLIACMVNIFSLLYNYKINKIFIYILSILFFLIISSLLIKHFFVHNLVRGDFTPFSTNPNKSGNTLKTIIFCLFGSILCFFCVRVILKTNPEFYYHRILRYWMFVFITVGIISIIFLVFSSSIGFSQMSNAEKYKINYGVFIQIFILLFVLLRPNFLDAIELKYSISDIMELSNKEGLSNIFNKRFFEDKYYLKSNATLTNFIPLVDRTGKNIDDFLQLKYNLNFIDLINKHRTEHFITLIDEGKHNELTIEHLGAQCGFKTRQALYISFKKFKGCSPSDYISNLNKI
jgi:AraC-like DNA-binding protein